MLNVSWKSMGFSHSLNWDTGYEFSAASGGLLWGLPYTGGVGTMINQPPLGFYIDSPVFQIFGLSFNKGVAIVTCLGLGCVLLVYLLGKTLYGKTTGLIASALFAVTPWQVVFSRTFLIDVQCLFFSLLFLLIGIYAVRKDSIGLFMLSGVFWELLS
jgi:4-amino-4-deoxy-L-arabinose transferase-like glycosyltransferase